MDHHMEQKVLIAILRDWIVLINDGAGPNKKEVKMAESLIDVIEKEMAEYEATGAE